MPLSQDLTEFTTTSPTIASYNFSEIVSGLGYIDFYLFSYQNETGDTEYGLGEQQVYSEEISDVGRFTNNDPWPYQTLIEKTFSTSPFNEQRTISGDILISFYLWILGGSGSPSENITVKLYDYDGTTQTEVASYSLDGVDYSDTNGNQMTIRLPSIERTIKRGNKLQLYIHVEYRREDNTNIDAVEIAYDPQNRDGENITPSTNSDLTTQSKISIPFQIIT